MVNDVAVVAKIVVFAIVVVVDYKVAFVAAEIWCIVDVEVMATVVDGVVDDARVVSVAVSYTHLTLPTILLV